MDVCLIPRRSESKRLKIKNISNINIKIKVVLLKKFEFVDVDTSSNLVNLKKIYQHNLQK